MFFNVVGHVLPVSKRSPALSRDYGIVESEMNIKKRAVHKAEYNQMNSDKYFPEEKNVWITNLCQHLPCITWPQVLVCTPCLTVCVMNKGSCSSEFSTIFPLF